MAKDKKNWWDSYEPVGGQDASGVVVQPGSSRQTRKVEADIGQSEASAAASRASAASSEATAKKTTALLPGELSIQDEALKEAKAKTAKAEADLAAALKTAGGSKQKAAVLRAQMLSSIRQYNEALKGQPLTRGFGLFEGLFNESSLFGAIPAYAAFEAYDKTNQAILPLIRPLVAQSAKEGDSDKEMAVFMSYIPSADDSDLAKEEKYRMLDLLISGIGEGKPPSEIIASGAKPRSLDEIESSIYKEANREAQAENKGLSVMPEPGVDRSAPIPGRLNEGELKAAEEGATLGITDVDKAYAARLQKAFDEGASAEQLQDLAKELYGPGYAIDPAKLEASIKYRDDYIRQGGRGPSGAVILPRERQLTSEEVSNVEALNDPTRAFFAKTGAALAGGQAPNITGIFDPAAAEKQRTSLDLYSEASPIASIGGTLAGAIPTTLMTTAGLMKAGLSPSLAALVGDVAYGTSAGAGESPDNPALGALMGATTGAGGSLVGRYGVAPMLEAGVRKAGDVASLFGKYIPGIVQKPTYSQQTFSKGFGDVAETEARLAEAERLGLPMSMADVSTPSQTLGRQVSRRSPQVAEATEGALGERAAGRTDRLKDAITKFVGQPFDDVRRAEDEIMQAADDAADPYYQKALARPAPVDDKIDNLLNTTLGRKGLQQAYQYAESRGVDPNALGFSLDEQGVVTLVQKPSWETLHYIRKGLQREIDQYRDPITRSLDTKNPNVDNAQNFLRRFDKRLDFLNPDYATARSKWAQYVAPRDYLELGIKALDPNTPPADVERTLARLNAMPDGTPEEAALKARAIDTYQRGFATAQRTAVDNASSADPYKVILGTPRQRTKLELIAPNAADFTKSAELEGRMLATEKVMAPSAPAAGRAEAEAGLTKADLVGAVGDTLLTGSPALSSANLVRNAMSQPGLRGYFADMFGLGSPFRAGQRAEEIAPDLFRQDPRGALDAMAAAREATDAYSQFQKPFQFTGTLGGGLATNVGAMEASREPTYSVAPQPLSQDLTVRMTFGNDAQVNPDGSVTTKDGMTVPPEQVRAEVAKTAKLLTPYYGE